VKKYILSALLIILLIGIVVTSPKTAALSSLVLFGVGLISIKNPKGYAMDKDLVFQNAALNSYDVVPTSAGTVYTGNLEIPPATNGRIAIECVCKTSVTPSTKDLVVYACVGNTVDPTTDLLQPIAVIPAATEWAVGTDFQWILPERFTGYKYIRLCFKQASTGTVTTGAINCFMHGLA